MADLANETKLEELVEEIPVIINPVAGKDYKMFQRELENRLGNENFNYYITKGKGDAVEFVSEKLRFAEKNDKKLMLLAAGGDGLYNEVINARGDISRLVFVPIPSGTSSDVARNLNLTNTARTCNLLNKILEGEEELSSFITPYDLISVNYDNGKSIRAVNLFSVGFDGLLCKEVNESRKKGGFGKKNIFVKKAVQIMKEKRYYPIELGYVINEWGNNDFKNSGLAENILMFTIITGRYAGGGMNYNPEAVLDDGYLEGFLVKNMSLRKALKLISHVLIKKDDVHISSKKGFDGFNAYGINYIKNIESALINILLTRHNQDYYFNVDGEHHKLEDPAACIKVDVLPNAIKALYIKD